MARAPGRKRILHLTADYPDANRADTTLAIRNFVKGNTAADHLVVSLNRTPNPLRQNAVDGDGQGDPDVVSMRYWGLPYGVLLALAMAVVAWRVDRVVRRRGVRIDYVHAHKLTFEGVAGYVLARRWRVPLVCSIRGEVESKIFTYKPHYGWLLRRILDRSERLYYVSAWFRPILEKRFPVYAAKALMLPNFAPVVACPPFDPHRRRRLITILRLDAYRKKGLDRLLPALAIALRAAPDLTLDIVGDGGAKAKAEIGRLIARHGLEGRAVLVGRRSHDAILAEMPAFAAMCLPSHNETFGMVYVEAMLTGTPILYTLGTGIDGFMEGIEGGIGVDARSVDAIADAIVRLVADQGRYRRWLTDHHDLIQQRFDGTTQIAAYNRSLGLCA
ncbi:glycosyltransferase family 4 protein [Marinivivus vitaminiproducens]|uniref:glycosyltransferase family 4 protein n=1 Tax=Marinivivus vitaminiproducens TaxID=3035935 RepID=UPI0027AA92B2|nr:glycosyltransferase family 4 protein [Geminicoccaceae bacterium SCSIO 64248]